MRKIIFATNNKHKQEEVQQILVANFEVLGLKEIGFAGDILETGKTLEENALIKSKFVFEKFGMNCFSDDTGLEIEALDGRPGVYSARYAGEDGNAENNIAKILSELHGIENRKARFRTVVSLILDGKEHFFEGIANGQIIDEKRGGVGFGYDPVFIPDGYNQTFAEMSSELKNTISHRKKAMDKLVSFLGDN